MSTAPVVSASALPVEAPPPSPPNPAESDLMSALIALGSDTGVAMKLIASMPPNLGNSLDVQA